MIIYILRKVQTMHSLYYAIFTIIQHTCMNMSYYGEYADRSIQKHSNKGNIQINFTFHKICPGYIKIL